MEVKVFIQQSKEAPVVAGDCRDKFLIQSTPVPPDWVRRTATSVCSLQIATQHRVLDGLPPCLLVVVGSAAPVVITDV